MDFEWDEEKARANLEKHRVSFDAAMQVFHKPHVNLKSEFIDGELRETDIGLTDALIVVVVTYTDRHGITRIISARKATRREKRIFDGYHS